MFIGYARTSTLEQEAGLAAQKRDLDALGCDKVFEEQTSATGERPRLTAAIDYLREGDTLVCTKLDRLARSVLHMGEIVNEIRAKGANLRILALDMDTSTPTGTLLLNMLGSVAQFEREMMLERQREGIQKAKEAGKYKGRKPTVRAQSDEVLGLHKAGVSPTEIARKLGIGRTSVYRILNAAETPA
ncbi:recombinase family protein [Acidimangrovimonas pyrenivorans]|uniref:Recombinase family protein n=1 Tax=Acidimangrovimonas pyrenivorans TaxID=2030798 RepID=A0ABV7AKU1_9RHOB